MTSCVIVPTCGRGWPVVKVERFDSLHSHWINTIYPPILKHFDSVIETISHCISCFITNRFVTINTCLLVQLAADVCKHWWNASHQYCLLPRSSVNYILCSRHLLPKLTQTSATAFAGAGGAFPSRLILPLHHHQSST